ncbi:sigma-70 family RNA polymerase sigma factor [Sphingomonas koreensis]|jgi:RNA polymerase sigma factor (sigma-70 family)|uniref:RNA polymerase subunit sigma-70 n=1 Tax=Sphingomonas koreensis TaxID=93064 RepID=A0A1L6JB41_9SPHN|nr:sigma-70 family RNA polymerase sigma factor [Sphingomonas koreensis]APR53159.1 RNA polymerase subunit sigma-70 [Sphingomonas koreensis]RSU24715.1 sigma-70 family RNA polymerase sigma factor [Sphingomonas koreensis]RSU24979.1 sigma-70 family RNA polymerase sigma factor [Sphingomonas koreensis]RSU27015.1 sigma-70 family RNA polymerase sigma factor [Sphingomonas koreensis]RSU32850.1 sigma-70 family RNA polymerase sigma factor [Sphingomonas koreensis]
MRLNPLPDHSLDEVVAEGDPLPPEDRVPASKAGCLDTLYRTHRDGLLRFIRRRARDDNAQDLVQQIFYRLARLTDIERRRIAAPAAYLKRAAGNLLRDEARQAERRSAHLHLCEDDVELQSRDQLAALEARDRLRRLEAALARLKPRTREIFLAHRIDGYSHAEIAHRTGLSIKTVEMHMTRAIAYLDRHRDA